jgi:nucleotide-binding universal stress UspA family protein
MKIVIGYDGSPRGADALVLGQVLAGHAESTLLLACAYDVSQSISARIGPDPVARRRRLRAQEILAAAPLDGLERATVHRHAMSGDSPAEALRQLAERERADLLVLGSTTRSGLARVSPGSMAERLMHSAPCALAVAPVGYAAGSHQLRTVAVAFDGRTESVRALHAAAALARGADASLLILRVIQPGSPVGGAEFDRWTGRLREDLRRGAEDQLAKAAAGLPGGLRIESTVLTGDAATALLGATSHDVDLLVAGSRAHGPLRRVLVGSVSGRLMHGAACPVCVVPRGITLAAADEPRAEGIAR